MIYLLKENQGSTREGQIIKNLLKDYKVERNGISFGNLKIDRLYQDGDEVTIYGTMTGSSSRETSKGDYYNPPGYDDYNIDASVELELYYYEDCEEIDDVKLIEIHY